MSDAVVTIVVIAHSVRHELERCFASVKEHAGMPVRLILVDNASTDDTLEWVAREHPWVEVVALPEPQGEPARNHGLERATTPYTMWLDSDAALTPGALPGMVQALEEHPEWGLVAPKLLYDDGTLQLSCRRFPPLLLPLLRRPPLGRFFEHGKIVRRHLMADFGYDRARPVLYAISACHLFRTELARLAGPFEPNVFFGWSDADWCFQIRDAGGEVVFLPQAEVLHTYRRQSKSRPTSGAALLQLKAFVYFQRKHWHERSRLIRLSRELDAAAGHGSRV